MRLGTRWLSAACAALICGAANAEVSEVRITKQFGVGFLPLMVMEDQKLVEKQSKAAGLPEVKGVFMTLSNPAAMNVDPKIMDCGSLLRKLSAPDAQKIAVKHLRSA
jgi:NitT/TauT family transport system substrate-binding protein